MRKTTWKQKVEKQATRALFLANYLLKNKPEDPAIEKLLKNLNQDTPNNSGNEKGDTTSKSEEG
jgi:hypothetical protein